MPLSPSADPPRPPGQLVRLVDVARAAGVGTMTASRALNGRGYVAPATRQKVLAVAERLGYRPNPMVQTLMTGVRKGRVASVANLAWIIPQSTPTPSDASTQELERGARARAEALGYHLDPISVPPGDHRAGNLARIFQARGIRGGVIAPLRELGAVLDLPWKDFAFTAIDESLRSPRLHHVMAHYPQAVSRILPEMRVRGYRRIRDASPEMARRAQRPSGADDVRASLPG